MLSFNGRTSLLIGSALLAVSSAPAGQPRAVMQDPLAFPIATTISAAKQAPAFAWLVRHGEKSGVLFARAPGFKPETLFARPDTDGQPVTDVDLSPDGRYIVFQTAAPYAGERAYNPAGLIDAPKPTLWAIETREGARPVEIGTGTGASFAPQGHRLVYRHGGDLWTADLGEPKPDPRLLAKGGASFTDAGWTNDGKSLVFVQDRGGYSFLGRFEPGATQIDWLVTGPDRLLSPTVSPDGSMIAYLRFPGRQNDVVRDFTESEPFAVDLLDLASGKVRTLWETHDKGVLARLEDPDSALRWVAGRLVFYSEHDGWGRLYSVSPKGGDARPLTPAKCEVAESEPAASDALLVIHNCGDLDTRRMSFVNVRTGQERRLRSDDLVVSKAASGGEGGFLAYAGGGADVPPLLRVMDLKSGRAAMSERASDHGYDPNFTTPAPRAVRFEAADGVTVPAQLFLPRGRGPHPAIIYVHGGPTRQMFPAFHFSEYYSYAYGVNRRLAEQGYAVLSVNFRSGVGYGRGFREPAGRGWRSASEYQDVVAAANWLAARRDVDPKRVGIWGGSYGGLLTAQALARNSDLFKAGVAVHGVFDWSWPSQKPGHLNPSRFFGVGEADRETARQASPISALDGWRSPVLLLSGDEDMNVDVLETVDLAQKLRARGVDVRTVIIPGEAHSFVRHSTWLRLWSEQAAFFKEKLRTP